MKNADIRNLAKGRRIYGYEIAGMLGISRAGYYQMLQRDLTDQERARILAAMDAAEKERARELAISS